MIIFLSRSINILLIKIKNFIFLSYTGTIKISSTQNLYEIIYFILKIWYYVFVGLNLFVVYLIFTYLP